MNSDSVSCPDESVASADAIEGLLVRSGLYAALGRAFSHPKEDALQGLRECEEVGALGAGDVGSRLSGLIECARSVTLEGLQSAYMHLFDGMHGVAPYEVEHQKGREFQKSQRMADVMGFYRAFGVEPEGDRPDHIACELEFMHLLLLKEAHALQAGESEHASVCRDAREKFFREHVVAWVPSLLAAMRARGGEALVPFYTSLMDLLEAFIEEEKEGLT